MSFETKRRNILQLMRDRELNDHIKTKYALKNNLNNKCISKLGLLTNLNGHQGCVNCLQWNGSGSTLASASDDFQVILWDPFAHKIKTSIKTLHRGNIFTVKFLPNCNDDVVATGAADWNSHTYNLTTGKRLSICTCAEGRVKRIAVANDTPSVFWSASEDGIIRQHDMRMNHECSSDHNKIGILSIYNYEGERIEAKCLDINQLRTEQLAVGANDPYVRLYDRRMVPSLSLIPNHKAFPELYSGLVFNSNSDLNRSKKAKRTLDDVVQYFVPGHIHPDRPELPPNKNKNIGITYLTFSPDGQELLVNYGSEYVYLYDLSKQVQDAFSNVPKVMKVYRENGEGTSKDTLFNPIPATHTKLPLKVEELKLKANQYFDKQEYTAAINFYNYAIHIFKSSSVLFSNRAAAYIKRKWQGDYYAALKDCVTALKLDPDHMKAHFRLIVCLYELRMLDDSKMYLEEFKKRFPSYNTSEAFLTIHSNIHHSIRRKKEALIEEEKLRKIISEVVKDRNLAQEPQNTFEPYLRKKANDYHQRYYGHCNTSTDIKEANFFGSQSQFIVAGSDDGLFFVWDKYTENNLLVLKGDSSIVNCVQPHPSEFMLATSGIDNEVKLWTPLPEDLDNKHEIKQYNATALLNQRRMVADPFELFMNGMRRSVEEEMDADNMNEARSMLEQFYGYRLS